jgi:hypothetical protein
VVDFLLEIAVAPRGKTVSLPAPGNIFFGDPLDPTLIEQAAQRAIECTGAEEHAAMAHLPYITKNGVAVPRFLSEAEEDEKHGFGDRKGIHKPS